MSATNVREVARIGTANDLWLMTAIGDPTAGDGLAAGVGSWLVTPSGVYGKTGAGNTAWSLGTLVAAAGTLTGTTLASNVVTSSLTTIGTLVAGAVPASLVTAGTFASGSFTFQSNITQSAGTAALQAITGTTGFFSGAFDAATTATISGVTTVGPGGTGTTPAALTLRGSSGSAGGVIIRFNKNSVEEAYIGTDSAINGGTSDDLDIYATGGNAVRIYTNAALNVTFGSATAVFNSVALSGITNITQASGTAALQAVTCTTLIGSDATDATNSTSGAFKTAGGMGIAKKLFVGTSLTVGTGFGCNAAAAQTAYASGGALAAYGAGANGFDTGANASALHALVVNIRAALVANGIMS